MNNQQRERFASGLQKVSHNEELFRELAKAAAEDGQNLHGQLVESLRQNDMRQAAGNAYALKGVLSSIDDGPATEELAPLVSALLSEDPSEVQRAWERAEQPLSDLLDDLEKLHAEGIHAEGTGEADHPSSG